MLVEVSRSLWKEILATRAEWGEEESSVESLCVFIGAVQLQTVKI